MNSFITHVIVVAGLVFGFILLLRWPRRSHIRNHDVTNLTRCKDTADKLREQIYKCNTEADLEALENTVDYFFSDNYDIIGHNMSMKLYQNLTVAIMTRRNKLRGIC
jgi:hypothetical protein